MPLPGMPQAAREEVRRLHRRGLGAIKIARELKDMHDEGKLLDEEGNLLDAPLERAIGREITKLRKMSESEQRRYDEVVWPESFGSPDLPYAAAATILELTRFMGRAPLVPLARWYWRTCQAFPGSDVATLHNIAAQLALAEGDAVKFREVAADAVAGKLGEIGMLGPFDASKPEDIERALHMLEIQLGALSPFLRQTLREAMEGRFIKQGEHDETQR